MTEKFIQDEKVAVLFSSIGPGWYTWNKTCEYGQALLFHPDLVKEVLEKGDVKKVAGNLFSEAYLGGVERLEVEWVQVGQKFRVHEYDDGSEKIVLVDEDEWITA